MLRYKLIAIQFAELLLYTWLVHDSGREGPIDWFVEVIGLALLVRLAIIVLTFVIARTPRQPTSLALSVVAAEYYAAVYIFSYAALRSIPTRFAPTYSNPAHLPVIFIHGFACNAGFWRSFIARFRPRWGAHVATINLTPIHGNIEDYAEFIEQRIGELLTASCQDRCLVVAHSMGGLATRHLLRNESARAKVAGVVTLGTPHSGTVLAKFSPASNTKQMRHESVWIDQLEQDEAQYELPAFEALVGTHDNIVSPQESAAFEKATNMYMTGISHLAMALNDHVVEWTLERCARLSYSAKENVST